MNHKLCISSLLFIVVGLYAVYFKIYAYIVPTTTISVCSALHHFTNCENSIYHRIDIIVSRSGFLMFNVYYLIMTYDLTFVIYTASYIYITYYISCIQHKLSIIQNDNIWIYYHIYFHLIVSMTGILQIHMLKNIT